MSELSKEEKYALMYDILEALQREAMILLKRHPKDEALAQYIMKIERVMDKLGVRPHMLGLA